MSGSKKMSDLPRLEAYAAPREPSQSAAGSVRGLLDIRLTGGLELLVQRVREMASLKCNVVASQIEETKGVLETIVEASVDPDCAEEIGYLGGHMLASRLLERCAVEAAEAEAEAEDEGNDEGEDKDCIAQNHLDKSAVENISEVQDAKEQLRSPWADEVVGDLVAEWTSTTLSSIGKLIRDAPVGVLDNRPGPFVVHLEEDVSVILREVRDDFSEAAHGDKANVRVGYKLWGGAVVLALAVLKMGREGELVGKSVLELGAGLGLCGLVAARPECGASQVTITDFHPRIVSNLSYNIAVNDLPTDHCSAKVLDWEEIDATLDEGTRYDIVIGSDIVCQALDCELVAKVLQRILDPEEGVAWITLGSAESRFGVDAFAPAMEAAGLQCSEMTVDIPEVCLPASEGSTARGEVFLGTARSYVTFRIEFGPELRSSA